MIFFVVQRLYNKVKKKKNIATDVRNLAKKRGAEKEEELRCVCGRTRISVMIILREKIKGFPRCIDKHRTHTYVPHGSFLDTNPSTHIVMVSL